MRVDEPGLGASREAGDEILQSKFACPFVVFVSLKVVSAAQSAGKNKAASYFHCSEFRFNLRSTAFSPRLTSSLPPSLPSILPPSRCRDIDVHERAPLFVSLFCHLVTTRARSSTSSSQDYEAAQDDDNDGSERAGSELPRDLGLHEPPPDLTTWTSRITENVRTAFVHVRALASPASQNRNGRRSSSPEQLPSYCSGRNAKEQRWWQWCGRKW